MVKVVNKEGEALHICEECGLAYRERTWAEECERFCSTHHACSLEITRHAVKMDSLRLRE